MIGILTLGTVPGLNRALRKAEVAALSRIGLPVLAPMVAPVTLPSGTDGDDDGSAPGDLGSSRFIRILDARLEDHRGLATWRRSAWAGRDRPCDGLDRRRRRRPLGWRSRFFLHKLRFLFRNGIWRRRWRRFFLRRRRRLGWLLLLLQRQFNDRFRDLGQVLDLFRGLDRGDPDGGTVKRKGAGKRCYNLPPRLGL